MAASAAQVAHMQPIMTALEAERIVENLSLFPIREVGSAGWMKQHEDLERLNAQSQYSIITQTDEFVVEALSDRDKIGVLIHELIVIEVWKAKVFPEIVKELAAQHSTKTYFLCYHEAIILGLLEKAFFHRSACVSGGDLLLELADYIYRKLIMLTAIDPQVIGADFADHVDDEGAETLERQKRTIEFGCGITCLTLLRFLTEYAKDIPLGVLTRLLDEQDVLLVLIPLLENHPWRRTDKGQLFKFTDGRWMPIERADAARLSKTEAQVWLALNNLICDEECRKKYKWNDFKKANIMRLTKFMNEVLIDQLPVLVDLRRALDTLNISAPPETSTSFLIQQVPELRDRILASESDWHTAALEILATTLATTDEQRRKELSRLAEVYGANDFEEFMEDPKCAACGKPAEKRCSRCKVEWYCGRQCQVESWKKHKQLCDLLVSASTKEE